MQRKNTVLGSDRRHGRRSGEFSLGSLLVKLIPNCNVTMFWSVFLVYVVNSERLSLVSFPWQNTWQRGEILPGVWVPGYSALRWEVKAARAAGGSWSNWNHATHLAFSVIRSVMDLSLRMLCSHLGFIFAPQLIRSKKRKKIPWRHTQGFVSMVTADLVNWLSRSANIHFVYVLWGKSPFINFWTSLSWSPCFQEILNIYVYSSVAGVWRLLSSSLQIQRFARMSEFLWFQL